MVSTPLLQSHPLVCIQLPDRQHLQLSVPQVLELKMLPYLKKEWRKKGGKNLQKEGGRKGGIEGKKGEREEGRERKGREDSQPRRPFAPPGFPGTVSGSTVHPVVVLFSHSVTSDSLRPHGLQHSRLPCPSLSPRVCSNSCPLSW